MFSVDNFPNKDHQRHWDVDRKFVLGPVSSTSRVNISPEGPPSAGRILPFISIPRPHI